MIISFYTHHKIQNPLRPQVGLSGFRKWIDGWIKYKICFDLIGICLMSPVREGGDSKKNYSLINTFNSQSEVRR